MLSRWVSKIYLMPVLIWFKVLHWQFANPTYDFRLSGTPILFWIWTVDPSLREKSTFVVFNFELKPCDCMLDLHSSGITKISDPWNCNISSFGVQTVCFTVLGINHWRHQKPRDVCWLDWRSIADQARCVCNHVWLFCHCSHTPGYCLWNPPSHWR